MWNIYQYDLDLEKPEFERVLLLTSKLSSPRKIKREEKLRYISRQTVWGLGRFTNLMLQAGGSIYLKIKMIFNKFLKS